MGEKEISEEQKRWVKMLADGMQTRDVAKSLGMPAGTFSYKLNLLRAKVGCDNMASLIAYFYKNKLID